MYEKRIRKNSDVLTIIFGISSLVIAIICFSIRLPIAFNGHNKDLNMFAARFILPSSVTKMDEQELDQKPILFETSIEQKPKPQEENSEQPPPKQEEPKSEPQEPPTTHNGQKTHKVIETQFSSAGTKYNNFYVKNTSGINLNIGEELKSRPDIHIKKNGQPQVLIIHTHTCECYMDKDEGFYYESFYPRTTDNNKNITQVGNAITKSLQDAGISTIHDITYHDSPSYNGSYSRSAKTIKKNLKKYPSIQVVLDIHRDGLASKNNDKIKPTFVYNGKKTSQVMIMTGCDVNGSMGFPDWKHNLKLALRLQQTLETMYPGMTRPMFFGPVKYNMNLTHGSLLIEVGADGNTLDEATNAGALLGNALACVLSNLK